MARFPEGSPAINQQIRSMVGDELDLPSDLAQGLEPILLIGLCAVWLDLDDRLVNQEARYARRFTSLRRGGTGDDPVA